MWFLSKKQVYKNKKIHVKYVKKNNLNHNIIYNNQWYYAYLYITE